MSLRSHGLWWEQDSLLYSILILQLWNTLTAHQIVTGFPALETKQSEVVTGEVSEDSRVMSKKEEQNICYSQIIGKKKFTWIFFLGFGMAL